MSTNLRERPVAPEIDQSLTGGQLNKWIPLATLVVCVVVMTALIAMFNPDAKMFGLLVGGIISGGLVALVVIFALSWSVEGRRRAMNRTMAFVIFGAFLLACLPLFSILYTTITNGLHRFDIEFFTETMRNVKPTADHGGALHAITGTLIVTGLTTIISVPIGLFTAIYLVEYGKGTLKRAITFLVDVMTGIPSIVAGLFAYSLFSLVLGPSKSGLAGAVALCVLMIPYIVRNCEEIIRLVPDKLREASYALGVTKWRTIVKIVLPTSISGIVSAIIIAIARIIGETAPLLITMGYTASMNTNPIPTPNQPINNMTALPVMVYYQYMQAPGRNPDASYARSWAGALVLVLIVMLLNIVGRWVAKKFAPKINR
ncbi:phosphate ABC transporter permease PstA [Propionimicrobium lymphophilum]|uniref:phosphate ABC transporter permease PstA n=1 Tax=Propionimicrobium lymphophilum TaxID=33012 RepID=UPI003EC7FF0A